jgi:hypothetical protein
MGYIVPSIFSGGKNMMEFFGVMDDELGLDDPSDLARPFLDYARKNYDDLHSCPEPGPPTAKERTLTGGRLCFVITKHKASSWAEDLAEMVTIEEKTRVFN